MDESKTNALGAAERNELAAMHDHAMATMPQVQGAAHSLADYLRGALPDVDDVTMGRVALMLGKFVGEITERIAPDDHRLLLITNQMMMAGLDLTALEWRGAPGE